MHHYEDIAIPDYIAELRRDAVAGGTAPLGTARYADADALERGVGAIRHHVSVSLSRPLQDGAPIRNDGLPAFKMTLFAEPEGSFGVSSDHVEIDCHGIINTHVDGFNHFYVRGEAFGLAEDGTDPAESVWRLSERGIITRGVHVDIPAARGVDWVDVDHPVTGADIEAALALYGLDVLPGDALILDMGRDRFEAAGHSFKAAAESPNGRPGVGASAAQWIAEHKVSAILWDMMDAVHPDEPLLSAHLLIWAIGQLEIDNCDFTAARAEAERLGKHDGMLILAPLRYPKSTASNVNPLWLL